MKSAQLFRMVTHNHVCPFGRKSLALLKNQGFTVDDHHLKTREETDAFKAKHDVKTTPQTFIDGKRIGGYDDLRAYFHKEPLPKKGETSYKPIIAIASVSLAMAMALGGQIHVSFVAIFMCLLAVQKLQDLEAFSNMFINYDLLGGKFIPYSYIYPFAELFAGVTMLSGLLPVPSAIVAILIGGEGAISVIKAVYIDKRDIKCACTGGGTNVPLGFVSLSENLAMLAMGILMLVSM